MRIALIGLQREHTPPAGYGAVGRIVAGLAVALSRRVEVLTVVAKGSRVSPRSFEVPYVGRRGTPDPEHMARYANVLSRCDVVHNHDPEMIEWLEKHVATPVVTTLHTNRLPAASPTARFAYLSEFQARGLKHVGFAGWGRPIIMPPSLDRDTARSKDLLVLGQVRPEKGIVDACRLAAATGRRLILAGPLAHRNETWFAEVRSRFGGRLVHVGEVADPVRLLLLRTSAALLFLSRPAEPLGLVMLEAMSVGTPVLALDLGACSELVADGVSGFVRHDVESLAMTVDDLAYLRPDLVQKSVERFSEDVVVEEHLRLYRRVAQRSLLTMESAS
ncbi:glycosyltransferase [Sphaerimonospora cavernae]|uniref:Glycosyltransferase n=1 Tax=Sphaerimonospora cavernae TaxID=1740611 RepID=A0ABV6U9F9_9ACTN